MQFTMKRSLPAGKRGARNGKYLRRVWSETSRVQDRLAVEVLLDELDRGEAEP